MGIDYDPEEYRSEPEALGNFEGTVEMMKRNEIWYVRGMRPLDCVRIRRPNEPLFERVLGRISDEDALALTLRCWPNARIEKGEW